MTKTIIGLLLASSLATGCIIVADDDATLTIDNQSDYVLVDIALRTSFGSDEYGPNILRGDALFPDEVITVSVECNTYDVFILDEDAVACELLNLDLCFNDAVWIIDNQELDSCIFARELRGAQQLDVPHENATRVVDLTSQSHQL